MPHGDSPSHQPNPDPAAADQPPAPVPPAPRPANKAPKLAVTLAQRIVHDITLGQLPPGTQMASESEMLSQYGVGRGTLREALRFLEINGVIEIKVGPRGGPVVARPDATSLAGSLSLFLQLNGTTFESVVQVRRQLEPPVAALAALRASDEEIAAIAASVEAMAEGIDSEESFLAANERFHELIAWASGNVVLALLLSSLQWIADGKAVGVDYPVERRRAILAAHRDIYEAIAARDAAAASERVQGHNDHYEHYLRRHYANLLGSQLQWREVVR